MNADVVALQEVKNERVLTELAERVGPDRGGYTSFIVGRAGNRGIACGLLSRFPVQRVQHHLPPVPAVPGFLVRQQWAAEPIALPRRTVIEAQITLPDTTTLTVFVLHFKSHLPQGRLREDGSVEPVKTMRDHAEGIVRSELLRNSEALFVRALVDQALDQNLHAQIAVAGDFNDGPDTVTLRAVMGDPALADRVNLEGDFVSAHSRALYACALSVAESQRYSVYARGRPMQIDHVLCSRTLFQRARAARFLNETLYSDQAQWGPGAMPSDHAPLVVEFA
jgi:endonuclease/exonuclease/phosphatase family metal-dependent hydrolase